MNKEQDPFTEMAMSLLGDTARTGTLRLDSIRAEAMLYKAMQAGAGLDDNAIDILTIAADELAEELFPEIYDRDITVTSRFMIRALSMACRKGAEYNSYITQEIEREAS